MWGSVRPGKDAQDRHSQEKYMHDTGGRGQQLVPEGACSGLAWGRSQEAWCGGRKCSGVALSRSLSWVAPAEVLGGWSFGRSLGQAERGSRWMQTRDLDGDSTGWSAGRKGGGKKLVW